MGMFKKISSIIAGAVAGTMFVASFSFFPENMGAENFDVSAASACTINTNKTYQRIRGFGGIDMQEWQGYTLSDTEKARAFGNGDDQLGLTVLRVFVNPNSSQWKLTLPTAQYATKQGATVFATPWEPPSNLGESGGNNGKLHLPKRNYGAYAKHLNDFGKYMKDNGVDLYSISVQNEPDFAKEWTYWSPDETTDFIANYGDQITSTRLMSPETFQYGAWNNSRDYYNKILKNSKAMANCDVFATHFYGTPRNKMDFPELENCGKEIWMTEVYVPNSDANSANNWPEAIQVAENIHNGLVVGNMSVYTWWYIKRSYSLIAQNGNNGAITKRGYMMAQFSKYVRPGDVRIDATEQPDSDILVSAYKHSDTQIEVVAINKGKSDVTQQFNVSGRTITNVDRVRSSGSENLAKTKGMEANGSSFYSQLPSNSVSTYIITLESDGKEVPSDPNTPVVREPITPDANGYYYHDTFENGNDEWEGRGGASASTGNTAYAGSKGLSVSGRTSAWHGAMKTLDSATFKGGQEYSFSVAASGSGNMMLSLQYSDSTGETKYAHIADGVSNGNFVQLANPNYKLPEGSGYILYVETEDGTDNFTIDEAIVAKAGTKIDGPAPVVVTTSPAVETTAPSVTTPADNATPGDLNADGRVDAFDLVTARKGLTGGLSGVAAKAADVNSDGQFTIADLVQISDFLLGKRNEFNGDGAVAAQDPQTAAPPVQTTAAAQHLSMKDFTAKFSANIAEKEPDSANQQKGGVTYGEIQNKTYYSNTCKRNKKYNVLLPPNYDKNKKYPVMYILHGYYENPDRMLTKGNAEMHTREMLGNAIAEGAAKEMICVFPDVYSSATQDACSGMDNNNNNAYDNFINQLTNDLMPEIEKNYSVLTGKDNTAITGFSMGGRESLLIGMKMADQIGYVGAICPAPGVSGAFKWDSGKEPYFLMITGGSNDTVVYDNPKNYHSNFEKNAVPHVWHYVNGGYHGDNCIRAHLYNFFRIAFQN